jgi:hypothetical protein
MVDIVCPHCFRAGEGELRCEIVQVVRADARPRFTRGQAAALTACGKRRLRSVRGASRLGSGLAAELVSASHREGVRNLLGAVKEMIEASCEPPQEADLVLLADVEDMLDEADAR